MKKLKTTIITTSILLSIILFVGCSSVPTQSVGQRKDGSPVYSAHGFMIKYHMYYWRPWFVEWWFGPDPISP
jgi:hypothetical protein